MGRDTVSSDRAAEVAEVITYLASDAAALITANVITSVIGPSRHLAVPPMLPVVLADPGRAGKLKPADLNLPPEFTVVLTARPGAWRIPPRHPGPFHVPSSGGTGGDSR
jgi:hypothetical protein